MKEIISIHIGGAGARVGKLCQELYCLQHEIEPNGYKKWGYEKMDDPVTSFFSLGAQGYTSRSIFVDLEPTAIDEIRTGPYRRLFEPINFISGKEDAGNCFARGRNGAAKDIAEKCLQQLCTIAGDCDNLQGFLVFNGVGGGTGSGLGSLLLENLSLEYEKKSKFAFAIYPGRETSPVIVDPYNTVLSTHYLNEHTDLVVPLDNSAIYGICRDELKIAKPTYTNLNLHISQLISSLTSTMRFDATTIAADLAQFQTDLVPNPRTHFMISSQSLVINQETTYSEFNVETLTDYAFKPTRMMVRCQPDEGKYMGCVLLYHGNFYSKDVRSAVDTVQRRHDIKFVDWCPTNIKRSIYKLPRTMAPGVDLPELSRVVTMIGNNTAITQAFSKMKKGFDKMYSKKAFLHWYLREGMEEGEFSEAGEDLIALMKNYKEAETEAPNEAAG